MSQRKRYALVGTGGRVRSFTDAILGPHKETAEIVGMCDLSQTRMDWYNNLFKTKFDFGPVPTYHADHFDRMIQETKPDEVIVTTVDAFHHKYIIRAMELGCNVVSEKPMTTTPDKARAIFDAIERTRRNLRVIFNFRYTPATGKMKEMIMQGAIGRVTAVELNWLLDTSHGADYFRRWHAEKDKSGGLLIHKATHHFDIVNWLIDSYPKKVFCLGDLKFYGKKNAEARGEKYSYARYTGHAEAKKDPFALFLDSHPSLKGLYLDAEKDSGYIRDKNVFGEHVTIEDTMAISAQYRNGAILAYSLIAYSPWEGIRLCITGTKGRLEYFARHGSHIIAGQSAEEIAAAQKRMAGESIWHFPMFAIPQEIPIPPAEGSHGGGDAAICARIFDPAVAAQPDFLKRDATHIDGAASCLLGMAANESMRTGLPVNVDDLLKLPEK